MTPSRAAIESIRSWSTQAGRRCRYREHAAPAGGPAAAQRAFGLPRALALATVALCATVLVVRAEGSSIYLPLVYDQTPTPVVTVTPLSGACVAAGQSIRFRDYLNDTHLEGEVAKCYRVRSLATEDETTVSASGVFIVLLLDVRNRGSVPAAVGLLDSFRLQASGGYRYDLAPLYVQEAASYTFGRPTVYSRISAGATVSQVFAFDVPENAASLSVVSEYPW